MSVILATAGLGDKIRFWEAPSGICSRILRYADSQVNCLEITTDKQYLAAGGNPHIRLFEINNSSNQNPILSLEGHTGNVTSLGFQRNGRYLYSGSEDGTVKIWDLRSPTFSRSFDAKAGVNSVALHPNQAEIISGTWVKFLVCNYQLSYIFNILLFHRSRRPEWIRQNIRPRQLQMYQ